MARDACAYLWDIQEACIRITRYTQHSSYDAYAADDLLRSAVERQFEIAGEALSQLSKLNPDLASRIPAHRQIISFRNALIHGYAAIDHQRVWQQVEEGIPKLHLVVGTLLTELDPTSKA